MKRESQELYRQYLNNDLTGDDLSAFENRLATDVEFKRDFALYKEMEGFLDAQTKHGEALSVLKDVGAEMGGDKVERGSRKMKWWLVAAALVIGIGGWYVFQEYQATKYHENLLAKYIYPPNRGTRSVESASTKIDSAIYYFDLRRMDDSKALFLEIIETDSLNKDANFYLGHIYFHEKNYLKTLFFLEKTETIEPLEKMLNN